VKLKKLVNNRQSLVEERAREKNRLEKVLEGGNIKLTSVFKDATGVSARSLIKGAIKGNITEETIDSMLFGTASGKKEELLKAMDGFLSKLQTILAEIGVDRIDSQRLPT